LTYIQTHFYVSPWGCTGGDFWKQGEGQFDCPKCGYKNRLYDRKEFQELKHYFKDIIDEHEH
jgi:transcription initiation factor IIE alpha subunit